MDYQTFEPVTSSRQTNKQKLHRNNFSELNHNFFAKPKITKRPLTNSQNQSQAQNYYQNVPQQASPTVFFNDQSRATMDRSKNYQFFHQNKNVTNKHNTRNQPHYSEDEDYNSQNRQRLSTSQHNNNWNIDQPDPIYH